MLYVLATVGAVVLTFLACVGVYIGMTGKKE